MKGDAGDRRTKYTKMVLRQSLLALMREKPVNRITVKEICALADVNRSTFYAHFADAYDLLRHIQEEFYGSILDSLQRYDAVESTQALVLEIVRAIRGQSDLCQVLFSDYGDQAFLRRLMYIAHDRSLEAWSRRNRAVSREELEYAYAFVANGSVGIIQTWIAGGLREEEKEIAGLIDSLTYYGLARFLPRVPR